MDNVKIVEQNEVQPSYEFNSYSASSSASVFYFGLDILTYFTQDQLADIIKDPMTYNETLRHLSRQAAQCRSRQKPCPLAKPGRAQPDGRCRRSHTNPE